MKSRVALGCVFLAGSLASCGKLFPANPFGQEVVLSDEPLILGAEAMRFSAKEPLKVVGMTSDLCVRLSNDASGGSSADKVDTEYERLMKGARLSAVLHGNDGKDYPWACGTGWSFSPGKSGRGALDACLKWECNRTPPKGTELSSVDLMSDRPLQILGVRWSSTDSFDHTIQPPADSFALSSAEYRDLEHAYGSEAAWTSPAKLALQVTMTSNSRRKSFSEFNSTLSLRLSTHGLQIQPGSHAIGMKAVTIPTAAVEACSMSCFGNLSRETDLLLTGPGVQLGFLNTPEVIDWCWSNHIPMASSASRREWLYKGTPLPARDSYSGQFDSRAAYDHQASQSCMGY